MRVAAALWVVWRNLKGEGEVDHRGGRTEVVDRQ